MTVARTPAPDISGPMSVNQKSYLLRLIESREMADEARKDALEKIEAGLTKESASIWIGRALKLPYRNSEFVERKSEMPIVPPGKYALGSDDDDSVVFYEVSIGAEDNPRWAGYVFLHYFKSDDRIPVKNFHTKQKVMTLLAADPAAASARYGLLTRRCGVCGRKLTKRESRERGIGPVCAERQGW